MNVLLTEELQDCIGMCAEYVAPEPVTDRPSATSFKRRATELTHGWSTEPALRLRL